MYRKQGIGNTIIREEIRQHESSNIRQQISTYLIPIRKDYFPIDTRFFTASLNLKIGMELLSIRSSDIAFTMGAAGPLLERAENYAGEIPLY